MSELSRRSRGELLPMTREERQAWRARRQIRAEVQVAGWRIDGAVALGQHAMAEVLALDEHRRDLAQNDPFINLLLAGIEETTIQQVKKIQRQTFDDWEI